MSSHDSSHGANGNGHKYELRDVEIPAIIKSGYSIFITMAVAFGLMYLTYKGLEQVPMEVGREATPMETQRVLPEGPRLLIDEPGNLKQYRAGEEQMLNTYQKDLRSGAIRIPVSEAMKAVASRGAGIVTGKPVEGPKQ
ncbi:MAG: hypothetical protein R2729_02785 [Bryobacteraceae bacterium]